MNAVAGGGSLLTFPALLAVGVSPLTANATSTVALVPGSFSSFIQYRTRLELPRGTLAVVLGTSVVGGVLGARLAMAVGEARFAALVPWLILVATALFAGADRFGAWARTRPLSPRWRWLVLGTLQLVIAIYGGFFGAGIGIAMLAVFALVGEDDLHRANALKSLAAGTVNGVAALTFLWGGQVALDWVPAMAVAAIVGGTLGARWALQWGRAAVRRAVVAIGLAVALWAWTRVPG